MNEIPKRILIVDDSATSREYLRHIIDQADGLEAAGTAKNGIEAIRLVQTLKPDLVTMDVQMPGMNGYDTARQIMEIFPVPIVIVSGTVKTKDAVESFKIMEAGALAAIEKPAGPGHPNADVMIEKLTRTIRLMSEIKVVTRKKRPVNQTSEQNYFGKKPVIKSNLITIPQVVAIGASTGGPPALNEILSKLPEDFPYPVLIVQHIATGFLPGMVKWLSESVALNVKIPNNREPVLKGHVYFAPDGCHMGINSSNQIVLTEGAPDTGVIPSVSRLFSSVAKNCKEKAVGILLTGMGQDGASGLKEMNQAGALTIAHDKNSCVVFGMPAAAIKINAASQILSTEQIADFLTKSLKSKP